MAPFLWSLLVLATSATDLLAAHLHTEQRAPLNQATAPTLAPSLPQDTWQPTTAAPPWAAPPTHPPLPHTRPAAATSTATRSHAEDHLAPPALTPLDTALTLLAVITVRVTPRLPRQQHRRRPAACRPFPARPKNIQSFPWLDRPLVDLLMQCGDVHPNPGPPQGSRERTPEDITEQPVPTACAPCTACVTAKEKDPTLPTQEELLPGTKLCLKHHPLRQTTPVACEGKKGKKGNTPCTIKTTMITMLADGRQFKPIRLCTEHLRKAASADKWVHDLLTAKLIATMNDQPVQPTTEHKQTEKKKKTLEAKDLRAGKLPPQPRPRQQPGKKILFTADDHENVDKWTCTTSMTLSKPDLRAFKDKLRPYLLIIADTDGNPSQEQLEQSWHSVLSSAKLFCRVPEKAPSRVKKRNHDSVTARLKKFEENPDFQFSRSPSAGRSESPEDTTSLTAKLRLKVNRHIQAGCFKKAFELLIEKPKVPFQGTEDEKIECLAKQHPKEPADDLEINPDAPGLPDFDINAFRKLVNHAANGSSPGRTGWRIELVKQMIDGDDLYANLWMTLFLRIANNQLPDTVRTRLTNCRLLGVDKTATKVRPIAVGETFYRLPAQMVLLSMQTVLDEHFGFLQVGINKPAGCEHVIHHARALLSDDTVLAAMDMSNAFNSPFRRVIKQILSDPKFAPLWPLWNLGYSHHTNLIYMRENGETETLKSERGTRQGDPLGALFFCLAINPVLEKAHAKFGADDFVIKSYMDDISINTTRKHEKKIFECAELVAKEMKEIGLEVHPTKSEWWSSKPPHDKDRVADPNNTYDDGKLRFAFLDRSQGNTFRLLGGQFGTQDAVSALLLDKNKSQLDQVFDKIVAVGGQAGFILLKTALPTKLNFTLRNHSTEETLSLCKWFDRRMTETFLELALARPSEQTDVLMSLPTRHGGLGLTKAGDTATHAFQAAREQATMLKIDLPRTEYRRQMITMDIVPQGVRIERKYVLGLTEAKNKFGAPFARLVEETSSKGAAACLRSAPLWTTLIPHRHFGAVLRLKTNSIHKALDPQETKCVGCKAQVHPQAWPHHLSGCARIHGANAATAHTVAKELLKELMGYCAISFDEKEPTNYEVRPCPGCSRPLAGLDDEALAKHVDTTNDCRATLLQLQKSRAQRPDIRFKYYDSDFNQHTAVLDVSMTSNSTNDTAMARRVKIKYDTYRDLAEKNNEEFLAIVISDTGAVSEDCKLLANILAENRKSTITADNCQSAIATIGCRARACSLLNGEQKHGVNHTIFDPIDVSDLDPLAPATASETNRPQVRPPPPHSNSARPPSPPSPTRQEETPTDHQRSTTPSPPPLPPVVTGRPERHPSAAHSQNTEESPISPPTAAPTSRAAPVATPRPPAVPTHAAAETSPQVARSLVDIILGSPSPGPATTTPSPPRAPPPTTSNIAEGSPIRRFATEEDERKLLATPSHEPPRSEAPSPNRTASSSTASAWATKVITLASPSAASRSNALTTINRPINSNTGLHDCASHNPIGTAVRLALSWHDTWLMRSSIALIPILFSTVLAGYHSGLLTNMGRGTRTVAVHLGGKALTAAGHVATNHGMDPVYHLSLGGLCLLYQAQRWFTSLQIWNDNARHSAQTAAQSAHLSTTRKLAWCLAALCHRPTEACLYTYFYAHPVLAAPLLWLVTRSSITTVRFTTAAITGPRQSAKKAIQLLRKVCDPTTATTSINLWAKHRLDTWATFSAYETLRGSHAWIKAATDAATFWWLLVSVDPWVHLAVPALPHLCVQAISHLLMYTLFTLSNAMLITMVAFLVFFANAGPVATMCIMFMSPGASLLGLSMVSKRARDIQAALPRSILQMYWKAVFTILVCIVLAQFLVKTLAPSTCGLNPLSWLTCIWPNQPDAQVLSQVLVAVQRATAESHKRFLELPGLSTREVQDWSRKHVPAALLPPSTPLAALGA